MRIYLVNEMKDIEIKKIARSKGVPISTIERDVAQSLILASLKDDRLIFKGGTCLQKIYIKDYRFSDDLDFTLTEEVTKDELESTFSKSCEKGNELSGIDFELGEFVEMNNGLKGKIDFRMVWKGGNPTKIKLDISDHKNELILIPPIMRPLMIEMEEIKGKMIPCYDLKEIIAEKVRSLFQRTRPRDLFDVWFISRNIDLYSIRSLIKEKFNFKSIEMNIDLFLIKREYYKRAWMNSLKHQMRDVPDFDSVFNDVTEELEKVAI